MTKANTHLGILYNSLFVVNRVIFVTALTYFVYKCLVVGETRLQHRDDRELLPSFRANVSMVEKAAADAAFIRKNISKTQL